MLSTARLLRRRLAHSLTHHPFLNLSPPVRSPHPSTPPSPPRTHPFILFPSLRSLSSHAPDTDGIGHWEPSGASLGENVEDNAPYAPVRAVIALLDEYHDLSGLPWWVVIATSTLAMRLSLLPVFIVQLKKMGKLSALLPKLPPPFPRPFSGISFSEQFALHRKKRKELGCPSFMWNFAFFAVQFPCFLLWMTSIRRMSLDGHVGFDSGGALWFQNLTQFPHGICGPVFPILVAGLHFINVQISFQKFKAAELPGMLGLLARYYKRYLDILTLPLFIIGFYIPQGSLVYWVTNSTLTLAQQFLIRNADVRKSLGLPAINSMMEKQVPYNGQTASTALHPSVNSIINVNAQSISAEHQPAPNKIESLSSQDLLEEGLQQIVMGNRDRALILLKLAGTKDPNLARAFVAIGQILCSKKKLVEAAEYFERAISKIREDEDIGMLVLALFGAGVSHIWEGNRSEGIEYLKRISQLKEPDGPMDKASYYRGLVMLGSELFKDGRNAEALEYLRRAAAYDPKVEAYIKECEEGLEERK